MEILDDSPKQTYESQDVQLWLRENSLGGMNLKHNINNTYHFICNNNNRNFYITNVPYNHTRLAQCSVNACLNSHWLQQSVPDRQRWKQKVRLEKSVLVNKWCGCQTQFSCKHVLWFDGVGNWRDVLQTLYVRIVSFYVICCCWQPIQ